MANTDAVTVENRTAAKVIYTIPDRGIRRELAPGQAIRTTKDEIEALSYVNGGLDLIRNHLLVKDDEILDHLNIDPEPEYYMSNADVSRLITEGSLDEFLDALDFAPEGVITLIKDLSVQLPLNDYAKRQALKEKTGFDVSAAIENYKMNFSTAEEEKEAAAEEPQQKKVRRVRKVAEPAKTAPKIIKK